MILLELSKKDTKMIQGLSILAMVCLHLFDKSYTGLFQPLIFIKGIPLSFYFAQLADFCVFGFAFCSGYAHMMLLGQNNYYKKRLKSLLVLMINFWIVLIVFTITSVCIGQASFMPGSVWDFLGTAFLYDMHYNGAWWYLWAYALLVIISPLILKAIQRINCVVILIIGIIIYCTAFYVRFYIRTDNYLLVHFGPFGMTLFEYMLGCAAFKIKLFTKLFHVWARVPFVLRLIGSITIFLFLLLGRSLIAPNVFAAPISGFIIISLFVLIKKSKWIENMFLFFGKHSTNIWLTHMFFCSVLFTNFVYLAKYPIFIFLLTLLITITISILIKLIEKPLVNIICNGSKR